MYKNTFGSNYNIILGIFLWFGIYFYLGNAYAYYAGADANESASIMLKK